LKANRGIGTASVKTLQPRNPFVDKVKGSTQLTGFQHACQRVPFDHVTHDAQKIAFYRKVCWKSFGSAASFRSDFFS